MTKSEKIIRKHLASKNGLTNPAIASLETGYAFSTCKRVFENVAQRTEDGRFFIKKVGKIELLPGDYHENKFGTPHYGSL